MKALYTQVLLQPENSFKTYLKVKKEFDAPWHYHPEYELTFIINSNGVRYVGNSIETFEKGDLILLGPNLPHCWKNTGIQNELCSSFVIQWKEDFLGTELPLIPEFKNIHKLLQLSKKGIKFNKKIALEFGNKYNSLLTFPPFEKYISFLGWLNEMSQINEYTTLCEQGFTSDLNYENSKRINIVYQYLKEHYNEKIALSDVALLVNMSEEAFSRFFSKTIQKPFFSFLNEYRINIATKLLIETDMQVAEICYSCGYESLPFFYRQFIKYKNCPPQAYRKKF
ncbi:MAG: AraC family transcriptional regulator [Chitinophagaceae bacterium]